MLGALALAGVLAITAKAAAPADAATAGAAPADVAALTTFVSARYSRLKRTIEGERKIARSFMSKAFLQSYLDEYHPDTEIPNFIHCATCPEFEVRIRRVEHEEVSGQRADGTPEGVLTVVELETVPRTSAQQIPHIFARRLTWRACSSAYPCSASTRSIEIMREDVLEPRRALSPDSPVLMNSAPTAPVPRAE